MASTFTIKQDGKLNETTISYKTYGISFMSGEIGIESVYDTYKDLIIDDKAGSFVYINKSEPLRIFVTLQMNPSIKPVAFQVDINNIGGKSTSNNVITDLDSATLHTNPNSISFIASFTADHDGGFYCMINDCTIGGISYGNVRFGFAYNVTN